MDGVTKEVPLGRKPKPAHLRRTERLVLQVTPDELVAFDQSVETEGCADRAELMRRALGAYLDPAKGGE